jgi:hypothetical protein
MTRASTNLEPKKGSEAKNNNRITNSFTQIP